MRPTCRPLSALVNSLYVYVYVWKHVSSRTSADSYLCTAMNRTERLAANNQPLLH